MIKKQYILIIFIVGAIGVSGLIFGSLILAGNNNNNQDLVFNDYLTDDDLNITWLGTCGFKIKSSNLTVYIDPVDLSEEGSTESADIVIISHSHSDHLSEEDLLKIVTNETTIYAGGPLCEAIINSLDTKDSFFVVPGENKSIYGIDLYFTPAYALKNSFHPEEMDYCGVIIDFGDTTIYHTGDSEPIEAMKTFDVDIVMLPMNEYVMTVSDMITAVEYLVDFNSPDLQYVIPMDYDPENQNDMKLAKEFNNKISVVSVKFLNII